MYKRQVTNAGFVAGAQLPLDSGLVGENPFSYAPVGASITITVLDDSQPADTNEFVFTDGTTACTFRYTTTADRTGVKSGAKYQISMDASANATAANAAGSLERAKRIATAVNAANTAGDCVVKAGTATAIGGADTTVVLTYTGTSRGHANNGVDMFTTGGAAGITDPGNLSLIHI